MIRSEKACKLYLHKGIVRDNKTRVNDSFMEHHNIYIISRFFGTGMQFYLKVCKIDS
jgi:hypothetical protein